VQKGWRHAGNSANGGAAEQYPLISAGPSEPFEEPLPPPTPSPTPFPVATPSPTPFPVATPSPTPFPVATPSPTPFPVATPSPTPFPVATPSPTPFPVATPSPPDRTPSPTSSPGQQPYPVQTGGTPGGGYYRRQLRTATSSFKASGHEICSGHAMKRCPSASRQLRQQGGQQVPFFLTNVTLHNNGEPNTGGLMMSGPEVLLLAYGVLPLHLSLLSYYVSLPSSQACLAAFPSFLLSLSSVSLLVGLLSWLPFLGSWPHGLLAPLLALPSTGASPWPLCSWYQLALSVSSFVPSLSSLHVLHQFPSSSLRLSFCCQLLFLHIKHSLLSVLSDGVERLHVLKVALPFLPLCVSILLMLTSSCFVPTFLFFFFAPCFSASLASPALPS
jgi:hypothetical protein